MVLSSQYCVIVEAAKIFVLLQLHICVAMSKMKKYVSALGSGARNAFLVYSLEKCLDVHLLRKNT